MPRVITWLRLSDEPLFQPFFEPRAALLNARLGPVDPGSADALLLTGGPDISAEFLRQPLSDSDPQLIRDPDPARDAFEFDALRSALGRGIPILAICKGVQVLNVALGGTLHLDIPGHDLPELKYHSLQPLRFAARPTVRFDRVNSSHHQAIDRLGDRLEVEAWCADDGVIEQVRLLDYPWTLGVQFHPERESSYKPLFDQFLDAVDSTA